MIVLDRTRLTGQLLFFISISALLLPLGLSWPAHRGCHHRYQVASKGWFGLSSGSDGGSSRVFIRISP